MDIESQKNIPLYPRLPADKARLVQSRPLIFAFLLLLSLLTAVSSRAAGNVSGSPAARRQILVLDTYQFGLPIPESIDRGLLVALREGGFSIGDLFLERLDFARFPTSEHRADFVDSLRHKFAGRRIGVVISVGAPATDFLAREGRSLFPEAAVLAVVSPNHLVLNDVYSRVMNIPWRVDPAGTLRIALDLFPQTRRVFVVTGARDDILPFIDQAREAFAPWEGKLAIEYSNKMSYEEMLQRVALLPADAIVISSPFFADAAGRTFVPAEVAVQVCRTAKVPVFATLEPFLGKGVVGGSLLRTEDIGKEAGRVALDYLAGRLELHGPTTAFVAPPLAEFDWRELTRWQLEGAELPKGSIVVNRPPTLWSEYRRAVVTAAAVILALFVLVVALALLNRRLRRLTCVANDSEARFRVMVEHAPEAIIVYDVDLGRIADVNVKAERLFGCSREKLLQGGPERFFAQRQPDGRTVAESMTSRIESVLSGEEIMLERNILSDDGRQLTCEVRLVRLPYSGQRLIRASFIDITDRRRAEEETARLEGQLLQSRKMEAVGRLAGGVAHDFNNMLLVILGHAEIARRRADLCEPLKASLAEISKAAERSADLTRQLLAFARKQTIVPVDLDLNEVLAGMITLLKRLIGENIELNFKPSAEQLPIKADPSQINQILTNLCVNARDAISDVGRITIETSNRVLDADYCAKNVGCISGDYVLLAVSDNGCGMDRETRTQIFEPFFTTKAVGAGTGLGLATVYGIVKQNNGFINVYSEPGQGTTFTIYLPRREGASQSRSDEAPRPTPLGHETILLVEDEEAVLTLTTEMLQQLGYTVVQAGTPSAALRLAREHAGEIGLLMTDMVMPEMNGRDLEKYLVALYPQLKSLFMSGYTADAIARHGILEEGVHFLQKPFSMQELADKLRLVLDGRS